VSAAQGTAVEQVSGTGAPRTQPSVVPRLLKRRACAHGASCAVGATFGGRFASHIRKTVRCVSLYAPHCVDTTLPRSTLLCCSCCVVGNEPKLGVRRLAPSFRGWPHAHFVACAVSAAMADPGGNRGLPSNFMNIGLQNAGLGGLSAASMIGFRAGGQSAVGLGGLLGSQALGGPSPWQSSAALNRLLPQVRAVPMPVLLLPHKHTPCDTCRRVLSLYRIPHRRPR
jgi:hypothetical protein